MVNDADIKGVTSDCHPECHKEHVYTSHDQQNHMQGFKFVLRCLGLGLTTVVRASFLSYENC